jgi:mono/diheme cytochrome c family protein
MRSIPAAAAGLLVASLVLSSGAASQPQRAAGAFPPGPGQRQVQTACGGCHAMTVITGKHYPSARWEQVVDRMVDRGARVSDADFDVVVAYLARNFGPPGR